RAFTPAASSNIGMVRPGQWCLIPSPASRPSFSVSRRAPATISGRLAHGFVEHFDGERWQLVQSPNPGKRGNTLYGIVSLAANRACAVGDQSHDGNPQDPLALSWDGTHWKPTQVSSIADGNRRLFGVATEPAGGLLAVGENETDTPMGTLGFAAVFRPGSGWIS